MNFIVLLFFNLVYTYIYECSSIINIFKKKEFFFLTDFYYIYNGLLPVLVARRLCSFRFDEIFFIKWRSFRMSKKSDKKERDLDESQNDDEHRERKKHKHKHKHKSESKEREKSLKTDESPKKKIKTDQNEEKKEADTSKDKMLPTEEIGFKKSLLTI